jgi:hypothetical protein
MIWQPIETAPRDQGQILLYVPSLPGYPGIPPNWKFNAHVIVGRRSGSADHWQTDIERLDEDEDWCVCEVHPTHWMPLPWPPQ